MKRPLPIMFIVLSSLLMLVLLTAQKSRATDSLIHLEFDAFPGVLPYTDPNNNLYIGWTLDLSSPGASEGRDVVTQKIGASINNTFSISIAGTYQVDVWVLDRGTTDKIKIDSHEWTFIAPATGYWDGAAWREEFKKVTLGEAFLSTGLHNVTLVHIAPGTAGSYPENSILDYLEIALAQTPHPYNATIDINPNTLNLKSEGKWITAYIELPEGYNVNNINVSTILLNDTVAAEVHPTCIEDHDNDGIPDLMVKFSRDAVLQYLMHRLGFLTPERIKPLIYCIKLTVTGILTDGTAFEGTDTISTVHYLKGYPEPV